MTARAIHVNSLQFLCGHDAPNYEPLLNGTGSARNLRVIIDFDVWERIATEESWLARTLVGFLHHERISVSLFSDAGPPDDAPRTTMNPWKDVEHAIGWTTLSPSSDGMIAYSVTQTTADSVTSSALFVDSILMAQVTLSQEGREGVDDFDARLLLAAQETHADLLITDRSALLCTELEERGNCRVANDETAVALVALYLRAAGEYIYVKGPDFTARATPSIFYEKVSDHLIPSFPEFMLRAEGVVSSARLLTIRRRARSLLMNRDKLALLTSVKSTQDVADAIDSTFTHALVEMVAFHDLLARVVNEFLPNPEMSPRHIKWQIDPWRAQALTHFPSLTDAWANNGFAMNLNRALRAARNEIHDVAPVITPFRTRWGAPGVGLGFFDDAGGSIAHALRQLPDGGDPGIQRKFADGYVVEPHVFLEFVLPWMLQSVDVTLAALLASLPARGPVLHRSSIRAEVASESIALIAHLREVDSQPRPSAALS
ncbi:hypothetical protein IWX81_002873 [Salinibacterium sp. CAN_S4]|uniref:hypothetical protein n=1 Tax=Salinibacterium sp. CAN_S4 TaxID=2787727 RepID=UPI0018F04708